MSLSANVSEKAALIWAIADKLTGVYKPHNLFHWSYTGIVDSVR